MGKEKKSPLWDPAVWIAGRSQERSRRGSYRAFFHGLRGRCVCPWGDPLGPSLLHSWVYQIFVRKSGLMRDIVKLTSSIARLRLLKPRRSGYSPAASEEQLGTNEFPQIVIGSR
jgi:hypothetical protein